MTERFDEILQFFKVLGNESRLKILGLLANNEHSVSELARKLGVREPTVSHHLAMMKRLGLLTMRPEGNSRIYALNGKFLEEMSKSVFSESGLSALAEDESETSWEAKVRSAFLEGDRIRALPARFKKRGVILRWLVERLEKGRRYPEPELNEILKQYHPDHASLRRYLIDYGLMQRDQGVYWRVEGETAAAD